MSNCRQSVRSNPLHIQPFLLDTANTWQKGEDLGILSRPLLLFLLNIQAIRSKWGCIWFFQDHPDSFQDHCIFLYNFNFLDPNSSKPSQTCPNSNFQISLCLLCPLCTRVSKLGRMLKTHSKLPQ